MEALERRQETLIEFARRERDVHLRRLRDEVSTCTAHLQSTTALVQFCIEALKEADSSQAAFLQIASMLVQRVSNLDSTWRRQEIEQMTSRRLAIGGASSSFPISNLQLTLDDSGLRRSIDQLTFLEMKRNHHHLSLSSLFYYANILILFAELFSLRFNGPRVHIRAQYR
jgi:tripartite motif-containing protein 9/67